MQKGDGVFEITQEFPQACEIRKVDMQGSSLTFWCQVDKEMTGRSMRRFLLVGTGREFDATEYPTFITTFYDTPFVWHLFEKKS